MIALFLAGTVALQAHAAEQPASCLYEALLQAAGDTPVVRVARYRMGWEFELSGQRGSMLTTTSSDGKTLKILSIAIPEGHKGRGYSQLLLNAAVREAGPRVESIWGALEHDNFAFFEKAFNKIPEKLRREKPTTAAAIAAKYTPFYKTAEKMGFTEIREAQIYQDDMSEFPLQEAKNRGVRVLISRPKNPPIK